MKIRRYIATLLLVAVVVPNPGCVYRKAGDTYRHRQAHLVVDLPSDWLQWTQARKAYVITKDGLRLEQIVITVTPMKAKIPNTERRYQPGMLPHELASFALGLIQTQDQVKNFRVERIELVTIADHSGYKATATFSDPAGLPKRMCLYGVALGDYVCEFRYEAARNVYYDQYLPAFEHMIRSARTQGASPPLPQFTGFHVG